MKIDEIKIIDKFIKSMRLLCVDDNEDVRYAYEAVFENRVENISFAVDGKDGYEQYLNNKIDFIITDYSMPNIDGLKMIEMIRKMDDTIPIILITAIDDKEMMTKALQLHINNFIQKPIDLDKLIDAIRESVKPLILHKYIKDTEQKKLDKLEEKEQYNVYQEDLGFAKELNILRNDYYYQTMDSDGISLIDFMYKPLDVLSGDAYSARRINDHSTFYLMIDGMGKGLSASLTAMIMTSFVNHIFDKMLSTDSFDIAILINETMEFIKPILLEEEALSIDYIVIDNEENMLYYAKFSMPVILMENQNKEIVKIKSNNPPLSKYLSTFNIGSYDISNIIKFLIYSDGIVENKTINNKVYAECIEHDFLNSFTREDLKKSFISKIEDQEDDITFIYIHKLHTIATDIGKKEFKSTLDDVGIANEWYEDIWAKLSSDMNQSYLAGVAFTELFMNAYEHGSLGISSTKKHKLLDDDIYFESLLEIEKGCEKKILVEITKVQHYDNTYVITKITDEGKGFDTQTLSEIFRNSKRYNGRGVFMSRKNSSGIYYNSKGNSVLYLSKIS